MIPLLATAFLCVMPCGNLYAVAGLSSQMERYYRAVSVLQYMGGPAAEDPVAVPRRIASCDATESLQHHPDKIFVLRTIADDLHSLSGAVQDAPLFEAYARLSLGEREKAADLLYAYLSTVPYKERHYALLASLLCEQREYTTLYLVCREWMERAPSCLSQRAIFTWTALFALGRYADARDAMLESGGCMGWKSYLYAARAALAMNDGPGVDALLKKAALYAADAADVQPLWESLRSRATF
jgi:hypothetical protein